MPISEYFATSYNEARDRFLSAARSKNAKVHSYQLPDLKGPQGEPLVTDVATIGEENAENVVMIISGTHGVEGFAGSGCQVGFFEDEYYKFFSLSTRIVLVHSLNPYGFAWLRRVNEDNIDLNRNFQDFSGELPPSDAYEELHNWLVPSNWAGSDRHDADLALQKFINQRGIKAFQAAIQGGQYSQPTGLFYGGAAASWSNRTLHEIIKRHVPITTKRLASIDIHTGLGPSGHGELIYVGTSRTVYDRCCRWYGPSVTNPSLGDAVSAKVIGTVAEVYNTLSPDVDLAPIALEFGTQPIMQVLEALRADHWLYATGKGQDFQLYDAIKNQIRNAFFVDSNQWKAAVYAKTLSVILETSLRIGAV